MTPGDDQVRLQHLVEAATKAVHYLDGRSHQNLEDDELLRLALTKLVEIVGDAGGCRHRHERRTHGAVDRGSPDARRLVHHYFDINLDVLWTTDTVDLPALLAVLPPIRAD
ncbi:MAG: hypothetical protein JWN29_1153 [Acidimicrobiales bacterium]|nr:hypothetical protein [Acidimicrobiales bacterium]